jgi:predicted nucleic acid-binding protein
MNGMMADSTVWIDYINPKCVTAKKQQLATLLAGQYPVYICPTVFQEVLQGASDGKELDTAQYWFRKCYRGRTGGYKAAEYGAEIYRTLRTKGITIRKPNDCLIAAYCILNDLALLHHDRDFDPIEKHYGLKVVH